MSKLGLSEAIQAARAQHKAGGGNVLDILLRSGVDLQQLAPQLAEQAGVVVISADAPVRVDLSRWDLSLAREWRAVVVRNEGERLYAVSEDPWDEALQQRIARTLAAQPTAAAAPGSLLATWLRDDMAEEGGAKDSAVRGDGPIVQFVDQALAAAFQGGASDVHFECDRTSVRVKHRIDGVMVPFSRMQGATSAQEVISRIKVLARLDITEQRLPQDGRFRLEVSGSEIDMRVSIMPSVHGEDAVLRLLDKTQLRSSHATVTLDGLGFADSAANIIRDLARAPSGMMLVTGPTGSGKTTTVYAALSEINTGLEKIVTIEDPVEYELKGVLQIPVNEKKGLTFAKGLRSILRHDPDRILVGEIRDAETATIAVQSALTGHLVFTTVHANNIADIVGRFRHFNLDMFGFMSALNGVIVQRLLRQVCARCSLRVAPSAPDREWLIRTGRSELTELSVAKGCSACRGTGYRGRFVVAEVHLVDDELRDHVIAGSPLTVLRAHATKHGVRALLDQAIDAVAFGRTSLEEVRRVIGTR